MNFIIKIADVYIEITSLYLPVWYLCRNYICKETISGHIVPDITISIDSNEIAEYKVNLSENPLSSELIIDDGQLEVLLVHRKITESLLDRSILLIHGSVVVTDEKAYMITAPSGTGKTLRSIFWLSHIPNSYILNGDKPYIIVKNSQIYACGSPWCGKENLNSNKTVPLQAILFLERSNHTEVQKLSFSDAFIRLLKQTYHPRNNKLISTIQLLRKFENKIEFYQFYSTKAPESVIKAYEVVSGNWISSTNYLLSDDFER